MDEALSLELAATTQVAAIAASKWVGKGNSNAADGAAVKAMREYMKNIAFDGTVVIGEGERDEAPMLYIGEKLGSGKGEKIDIAIDPLEGTGITARGDRNALSVLAAAPQGMLLHAPDTYMNKIAVGPKVGNVVSLDKSVEENLQIVAKKLGKPITEVTAIILDRPRHKEIIEQIKKAGAKIKLIGDGDVMAAFSTTDESKGIDILFGIGGAPEGVLAAVALKCIGGYFEGRLTFRKDEERERAIKYGMNEPDILLKMDDLAKGNDLFFVATGVTDGDFLKGVSVKNNETFTHSMLLKPGEKAKFIEKLYKL